MLRMSMLTVVLMLCHVATADDTAPTISRIEQLEKRIQELERLTAKQPQNFAVPAKWPQVYSSIPSPAQLSNPRTAFSVGPNPPSLPSPTQRSKDFKLRPNQSYLPSPTQASGEVEPRNDGYSVTSAILSSNPEVPIFEPPQVGTVSDMDSETIQSTTFEAITVDGNPVVLINTKGVRITVKSLIMGDTQIAASPKGILMKHKNTFVTCDKFELRTQLTITKMDLISLEIIPQEK